MPIWADLLVTRHNMSYGSIIDAPITLYFRHSVGAAAGGRACQANRA